MSRSFDQAGELSDVAPRAFPPESLLKVFVPAGGPKMREEFRRWGGRVQFFDKPDNCGVVIFSSPCSPWVPESLAAALRPFYARGGTECSIFEYDVVTKVFVRRGPEWLDAPGRVVT